MQHHESSDNPGKTERINLRVDRSTKELIAQAAARDHRSLTSFIVTGAKRYAEQVMQNRKKPFGDYDTLEEGYRAMAADEQYNKEALEWIEGLIGDVADEEG